MPGKKKPAKNLNLKPVAGLVGLTGSGTVTGPGRKSFQKEFSERLAGEQTSHTTTQRAWQSLGAWLSKHACVSTHNEIQCR
eukprot:2922120-Rhodomonas_salina.1